jgi:hypothetical protein
LKRESCAESPEPETLNLEPRTLNVGLQAPQRRIVADAALAACRAAGFRCYLLAQSGRGGYNRHRSGGGVLNTSGVYDENKSVIGKGPSRPWQQISEAGSGAVRDASIPRPASESGRPIVAHGWPGRAG